MSTGSFVLNCAAAVFFLAGCRSVFECADDSWCRLDGVQGRCELDGYCSFPDGSCPSGFAYGEFAPNDLARTCVPEAADGPTSSVADTAGETSPVAETETSTAGDDDESGPDPLRPPPDVGEEPPEVCAPPVDCTLYVALEGDDANFGKEGSPVATIQRGVELALPGDVICVGPGEYYGTVDIDKSGEPDRPIVLRAATSGTVVLHGRIYIFVAYGTEVGDLVIEGLEIVEGNDSCVYMHSAHDVVLRGNYLHDCRTHCLNGSSYRLLLDGNTFRGCGDVKAGMGTGTRMEGSEGVAINNVYAENVLYGFYLASSGWDPDNQPNHPMAEYYANSRDWLFSNNVFIDTGLSSGLLIYHSETSASLIQNNIFVHNSEAEGAIGPNGIAFSYCGGDHVVRNNLYLGGVPVSDSSDPPSYVESGALLTDPRFFDAAAADYRLQPGSPALDAGMLDAAPNHDIVCAPRPSGAGVDLGVFEMQDE